MKLILVACVEIALAQINLGSFFLHPQQQGGFDMGMGQGANILGFGGDRSFNLAGNRGGFSMGSNNGALIGGQRVGVDGGIGGGRDGVEMGSQVQFGNNPQSMHPAGQFGSFLEDVKRFFSFLGRGMPMPPQSPPSPPFSLGLTPPPPTVIDTDANGEEPWSPTESTNDGEAAIGKSTESEIIEPNNGDSIIKKSHLKTEFNIDEESTDEIFNTKTERPRQLPGLVDFN